MEQQTFKRLLKKIIIFTCAMIVFTFVWNTALNFFEPAVSTDIALGQGEYDSDAAHMAMRSYGPMQNILYNVPFLIGMIGGLIVFAKDVSSLISYSFAKVDSNRTDQ